MTKFIGFPNQNKVILPRQGMHRKAFLMRFNGPRDKISRHLGVAVTSKAGQIFAKVALSTEPVPGSSITESSFLKNSGCEPIQNFRKENKEQYVAQFYSR